MATQVQAPHCPRLGIQTPLPALLPGSGREGPGQKETGLGKGGGQAEVKLVEVKPPEQWGLGEVTSRQRKSWGQQVERGGRW